MTKSVQIFPLGHLWIKTMRSGVNDYTFAILVEKNGNKHAIASGPIEKKLSRELDTIADHIREIEL